MNPFFLSPRGWILVGAKNVSAGFLASQFIWTELIREQRGKHRDREESPLLPIYYEVLLVLVSRAHYFFFFTPQFSLFRSLGFAGSFDKSVNLPLSVNQAQVQYFAKQLQPTTKPKPRTSRSQLLRFIESRITADQENQRRQYFVSICEDLNPRSVPLGMILAMMSLKQD